MGTDKATADLRAALNHLVRSVEGECSNPACQSQHVGDAQDCVDAAIAEARAALDSDPTPDRADPERRAEGPDVGEVERVLRRYFQAVDASGRSRSWWRLRAEEVAAALTPPPAGNELEEGT